MDFSKHLPELWSKIILILFMFTTMMFLLLIAYFYHYMGLEMQWQNILTINDCLAHNVTNASICLV